MEKNIFKKSSGFTLIEMLIVVAIIAVLASIFLVGLSGFRGAANDSRRLSDLQKVQSYLELYYNKNGSYPAAATWADLGTILGSASIGVNVIPSDPVSGQNYYYIYNPITNPQQYVMAAILSDAKSKSVTDETGSKLDVSFSGWGGASLPANCGHASVAPIGGVYCVSSGF